jgi:cytochrome c5
MSFDGGLKNRIAYRRRMTMKKIFKWIGIILGMLVLLVLLAAGGLYIAGSVQSKKTRDVQVETISIPTDEKSLARGKFLVDAYCTPCHGEDLSGKLLFEEPGIVSVYSANITGLSQTHTDTDLVRAIRHGIDTDGRELFAMAAEVFIHFSEEDLGSVIAYVKTVPRIGEERPGIKPTFAGTVMLGAGLFGNVQPAEYIDHNMPFPKMPPIGASVEYGKYFSGICETCHGSDLRGAQPPQDPESPFAPDLTQSGELVGWTEQDFITAMRTGVTPSGRTLAESMPVEIFKKYPDDELRGLWMYLQTQ